MILKFFCLEILFSPFPSAYPSTVHTVMPKETKNAASDAKKGDKKKREKKNINTPITREATINLHKRIHGVYANSILCNLIESNKLSISSSSSFKNRAPRAVKEIKKFAAALMKTSDVRVDTKLNKQVWSQGVRNVPFRVRVRLARKRNEDEEAKEKMYTLVTFVPVRDILGEEKKKNQIVYIF